MKFIVCLVFLAVANCEELGWSRFGNLKPNVQIKEWREEFPQIVRADTGNGIQNRIIRGTEVEQFRYPFQVIFKLQSFNGFNLNDS